MSVQISAIVCTHNRAAYLQKALQSLVDQTLDKQLYEIIVVDNRSKDNTKAVVDSFADAPNLRYIYEPALGLSRARNAGWQAAHGEYVAFLDDDGVAAPDWLAKILEIFATTTPRPGVLGGKSEPIWEAVRPDWLSDHFLSQLAIIHWSEVPTVINEEQWLPGCNVAYPKALLAAAGGFREDLGRQGANLQAGEETYLQQQLEAMGYQAVYHPEMVIGHHVSANRLVKNYFRRKRYWSGLSQAVYLQPNRDMPMSQRLFLTAQRLAWTLPRMVFMLVARHPASRFRRQCQVFESLGFVLGLWGVGVPSGQTT